MSQNAPVVQGSNSKNLSHIEKIKADCKVFEQTAAASDVEETVSLAKKDYYTYSEAEADESELFGHREPQ